MLGYSVHAYDTRATIMSDGLMLRGVGYEIMPPVSFDNGEKEQFPILDIKKLEEVAHLLPQADLGVLALMRLLKQWTAQGLDLVDQKGQHHQKGEVGGQMLVAMSIVVLKMVALIFQRVEGFILYFPSCASSSLDVEDIFLG